MSKKTSKDAIKAGKNFFNAWKVLNHEEMFNALTPTWKSDKSLEGFKKMFADVIVDYKIYSAMPISKVVFDLNVKIYTSNGDVNYLVRAVCEKGPFKPSEEGEYKINPVSFRKQD